MQLLLRSLDPRFIRCDVGIADDSCGRPGTNGEIEWGGFPIDLLSAVPTLSEADGIQFLCPLCFLRNGGPINTHRVAVYFQDRGAPAHIGRDSQGRTARWSVMGSDFLDLTLTPSIHIAVGCGWHGRVGHGIVTQA